MSKSRFLGLFAGYGLADFYFHSIKAYAMGVQLETAGERIGAVCSGLVLLFGFLVVFKYFFSASFFHGFIVASGLFLSFDIVVFHWFFHLHRITNGPEADWLEPIFVVFGIALLVYGIWRERNFKSSAHVSA
ncbi:DUF2243 domain-containing protein [Ectobacillus ponti]|uniref:DUF2243 domain-containing protein n=1 Tax=Ectobacillus ponti TaxID=2961894 RepID=A0AA42BQZ7_9BACI|nr:DUF2243 domain-containing protein [Ectobacillus ponti]MCP8970422.1 DUF2243 domain-containing protein [Ectobacillus ponti]